MEMNAVGEEVCIGGLPFNALRQGLRNLDLAGSHSFMLRHRIFPEVAGQRKKTKKIDADLHIGQERGEASVLIRPGDSFGNGRKISLAHGPERVPAHEK